MKSELHLMEMHSKVLFKHNEKGKITHINEPPYDIAPRFYIGSTREGNVIKYLDCLNEEDLSILEKVLNENSSVPFVNILQILSKNNQIDDLWIGPAYVFEQVSEVSPRAVKINNSNKQCLLPNFPYTYDELELKEPCYAIIENNIAVSICCSARQTDEASEASVYTLEDFRGKEYGVIVSKAWAADIQSQGRIALYSTSWDNYASQAVARKLKLVHYGTDIHFS
ncbi:GNAT family N-acetyltransferase [Bacillus sp. AFS002410]|uniref:GNAT family N-acetyltransferase n=1 Tax=Bacillus sp. AFS002410 TaxID=2033481 RepID=UPI000BEF3279|nr:GNAT family N-acetyltransferase [Bacillus sp. AFS002410]PEJ57463.1 GNAT family N-acetyltransferase [Bacillus sp. AFS002410]